MLKRSSITIVSIVAGPAHRVGGHAAAVSNPRTTRLCVDGHLVFNRRWRHGRCMVAGSVAFRRSDDVQLRLTVYPMRPDLESLDRLEGERGAFFGLLVFVAAIIAGAIGGGLFSLA